MVDKYFRGRTDVDNVENVIISRVSFPYSYPQWMITMLISGSSRKTCIIWDNDKRTYEEVKMKNPLSFTLMMITECRTGGHSQQII